MKSIRILGREYKVKHKPFTPERDSITFGCTRCQKHEIHLNRDNCSGQNTETLFHEIFHVVSNLTGSNLNEKQITAMSSGVYSVLRDNRRLL